MNWACLFGFHQWLEIPKEPLGNYVCTRCPKYSFQGPEIFGGCFAKTITHAQWLEYLKKEGEQAQ